VRRCGGQASAQIVGVMRGLRRADHGLFVTVCRRHPAGARSRDESPTGAPMATGPAAGLSRGRRCSGGRWPDDGRAVPALADRQVIVRPRAAGTAPGSPAWPGAVPRPEDGQRDPPCPGHVGGHRRPGVPAATPGYGHGMLPAPAWTGSWTGSPGIPAPRVPSVRFSVSSVLPVRSVHGAVVMVRRRSTVRFRNGAPVQGHNSKIFE
jgi:hypothetical protein